MGRAAFACPAGNKSVGRLAYGGIPQARNAGRDGPGRFPEVECVEDGFFTAAARFNCHLSVRQPGREFLYKPNCKVSTAAACGAVLITTRDLTTVELLGEDYPFYCEPDPDSIHAAIARARTAVGSPEWQRALDRLREVRELTSMNRVLDQYEDLLRALSDGE